MNETLLLVKRGKGCECSIASDGLAVGDVAPTDMGQWIPCPHGTTVEVLNARVAKCGPCRGVGRRMSSDIVRSRGGFWMANSMDSKNDCPDCLGTGLRLVPPEEKP